MHFNFLRSMILLLGSSLVADGARAGTLYVTNSVQQNPGTLPVARIDTTTGQQAPAVTTSLATLIGGLALDPSDNLYVAWQPATGAPFIEKYTTAGVGSLYAVLLPGTVGPQGMSFDANGNLYVASFSAGGIQKITPGGAVSTFANIVNPTGVAISPVNGNLYTVSGLTAGSVLEITPGGTISPFFNVRAGQNQLAFDRAGNLYAVDPSDSTTIDEITPAGSVIPFAIHAVPPSSVGGLAFDSLGNLYASTLGNETIVRIAPNGIVSSFASFSSGFFPQFLAVQPTAVPEPASLTLIGVGGLTLALRYAWRRRRGGGHRPSSSRRRPT
jgi:sugar lactone lactonase YvrE